MNGCHIAPERQFDGILKDMALIRFLYKINPYELPDNELRLICAEMRWLIESETLQKLSPF
jgi:hypothetical protein